MPIWPVLVTALGVGGATVIGAGIGFAFKKISHKFSDIILSFAAGVMLAAAILGLIIPSVEYGDKFGLLGGKFSLLITVAGVFAGAICLNLTDRLVPHLHKITGIEDEKHNNGRANKIMLFVLAIAIHNLPEGIAAGVGFGAGDDPTRAIVIAAGIALQNIPEGMVIIAPMLSAGVKPGRTFLIAALTGLVEVVGTLIGFAVSFASAILPFALAFAGGTMLYVVSDEMIPETHAHGHQRGATYALLVGFCLMFVTDHLLG